MPFALITIGVLIFFSALNNTAGALGKQLYADLFSEDGGFVYWVVGIVIVGAIGYIPSLKKPSDLFMVLIILAMLLQNKGFFQQLQSGLQSGPSGSTTAGTGTPSTSAPTSGLFSGPLGSILLAQQAASGTEPLTTPAPAPAGQSVPLGLGGIGAA
jgi:hypothetical protein